MLTVLIGLQILKSEFLPEMVLLMEGNYCAQNVGTHGLTYVNNMKRTPWDLPTIAWILMSTMTALYTGF